MACGFEELEGVKPADVYVINTCTVTSRADMDSFGFMRKARRENPKARILVTGCLAQLDEDKIRNIDKKALIIKKGKIGTAPYFINKQKQKIGRCPYFPYFPGVSYFKGHTRAFLKIQDGCENFCAYCKVPLVRGKCKSKPLELIVKEAGRLVENGVKEIVLTGICLGSYGNGLKRGINLCDVIERFEQIAGHFRIRLSSIEAGDVSEEIIERIAKSAKLCRHLHIPIQSGDDEILRKMRRKYTASDYLRLIEKIKKNVPGIAITTDCLVGFPGEAESNFRNTLNLIKKIVPLKVHIFPYSKREGTFAASNYSDTVSPETIKERIAVLKEIADGCSLNYRKQFLGNYLEVLVEARAKGNPSYWQGHADNYMKVLIKAKLDLKNRFVSAKIKNIKQDYSEAEKLYLKPREG